MLTSKQLTASVQQFENVDLPNGAYNTMTALLSHVEEVEKERDEKKEGITKIGNMCEKYDNGEMPLIAVFACIESLLIDYGFEFKE